MVIMKCTQQAAVTLLKPKTKSLWAISILVRKQLQPQKHAGPSTASTAATIAAPKVTQAKGIHLSLRSRLTVLKVLLETAQKSVRCLLSFE